MDAIKILDMIRIKGKEAINARQADYMHGGGGGRTRTATKRNKNIRAFFYT